MVLKIKKTYVFLFVCIFFFTSAFIYFLPFITNAEEKEGLKVPIVMYHQITKLSSRKGKYAVGVEQFEEDMKYIKEKGYTTIDMQDLIDYTYTKKQLPEKVIIVSIDDGFESVYEYVYPIMKKYKMCAVASIVGEYTNFFTDNPDHNVTYSYMDWGEVKELVKSNEIEIQNHSFDLHKSNCGRNGISKKSSEDTATYVSEVGNDLQKMQNMMYSKTGYKPNTLTFPFGAYKEDTITLAKQLGFKAALLCEEKINIIKPGDTESLYHLGRFNRPASISTERFFDNLLED